MVKSVENGTILPPFLVKCYEMVDDESTNELISWSQSNDSFIIWDDSKFSSELLPKYFKHSNFSSFVRQLNIYGFRKTDTDQWEFANESFVKGQKHLLKNITRRKQPQGVVQRKSSQQKVTEILTPEEDRRVALRKEVENLKTDKNALMQELVKLSQHQQISKKKMLLLREQLKGMEKNQQQMLSFIVMAMQNPGFFIQLLKPKENSWRMSEPGKNILNEVTDDFEEIPSGGMLVRYQPPTDDDMLLSAGPNSNPEDLMDFDISSDEMRDFFVDMDFLSEPVDGKEIPFENPSQLVIPDIPGDDYMLEQLLLPYYHPSTIDEEAVEPDTEPGKHAELSFLLGESNFNGSGNDIHDDQNEDVEATGIRNLHGESETKSMDVSTKKMGSLNSETGQKV